MQILYSPLNILQFYLAYNIQTNIHLQRSKYVKNTKDSNQVSKFCKIKPLKHLNRPSVSINEALEGWSLVSYISLNILRSIIYP